MEIIALVTQKGGCGKSTLTLSLAVAARGVNRRTLILDTDPQRTVSTWWQDREQDTPDCVEVFESTALPKALDLAKQKRFDLVFIDTPGRDDPHQRPRHRPRRFLSDPLSARYGGHASPERDRRGRETFSQTWS